MNKINQYAIVFLILGVVLFAFHLQTSVGELVSRQEMMRQAELMESGAIQAYSSTAFYILGFGYGPSWTYFFGALIYCALVAIKHRIVRIVFCSFFVLLVSIITILSIELYGVPIGPGVSDVYFESSGPPVFLYLSLMFTATFSILMAFETRAKVNLQSN